MNINYDNNYTGPKVSDYLPMYRQTLIAGTRHRKPQSAGSGCIPQRMAECLQSASNGKYIIGHLTTSVSKNKF